MNAERVFNPSLNGKPVVVLSSNDGNIISRSNEAKALNIPMGAPVFKYKKLIEKNKVILRSSNYSLYGDLSNRIFSIVKSEVSSTEIYSIDEIWMDFKGMKNNDIHDFCSYLKNKIFKWTGIPVSIGIANTKALSKVANRIAKKYPKHHNGVYIMETEKQRLKALKWLDVNDIWGIGHKYAQKLNFYGIKKAIQFTDKPESWVKNQMTIKEVRLHRDLRGLPTLSLEDIKSKKAIGSRKSFSKSTNSYEELRERLSTYTYICTKKLRKQNNCCNAILVSIATDYFRKDLPQYRRSILVPLPYPTNTNFEIIKYAITGLKKIYKEEFYYKRIGIMLLDFTPNKYKQLNFFYGENLKHIKATKAMDQINTKLGVDKLKMASQDLGRTWKMKQEKLSPRYSTQWNELITVKAIC